MQITCRPKNDILLHSFNCFVNCTHFWGSLNMPQWLLLCETYATGLWESLFPPRCKMCNWKVKRTYQNAYGTYLEKGSPRGRVSGGKWHTSIYIVQLNLFYRASRIMRFFQQIMQYFLGNCVPKIPNYAPIIRIAQYFVAKILILLIYQPCQNQRLN